MISLQALRIEPEEEQGKQPKPDEYEKQVQDRVPVASVQSQNYSRIRLVLIVSILILCES